MKTYVVAVSYTHLDVYKRQRLQYTMVARSGRLPMTPPGVKASVFRR